MASLAPEEHIRFPVLSMKWLKVAFVHWPVAPERVQAVLPRGLTVDQYDGSAWLTLTPLLMADVRPPRIPPVPRLSTFPETNLRTYVRGPDGRDGLWFFTLEAANAAMTFGGRLSVGAPYRLADLTIDERDDTITYAGKRRGGIASYRLVLRPGDPLDPTDRDVWLTGRWRAYTRHAGLLLGTPVEHEPWPLRHAAVEELEETLTVAAGLPVGGQDPALVHFSDGVQDVRLGVSQPLARTS